MRPRSENVCLGRSCGRHVGCWIKYVAAAEHRGVRAHLVGRNRDRVDEHEQRMLEIAGVDPQLSVGVGRPSKRYLIFDCIDGRRDRQILGANRRGRHLGREIGHDDIERRPLSVDLRPVICGAVRRDARNISTKLHRRVLGHPTIQGDRHAPTARRVTGDGGARLELTNHRRRRLATPCNRRVHYDRGLTTRGDGPQQSDGERHGSHSPSLRMCQRAMPGRTTQVIPYHGCVAGIVATPGLSLSAASERDAMPICLVSPGAAC